MSGATNPKAWFAEKLRGGGPRQGADADRSHDRTAIEMRRLDMIPVGDDHMWDVLKAQPLDQRKEARFRFAIKTDLRARTQRLIGARSGRDFQIGVIERMKKSIDVGVTGLCIGLAFRHEKIASQHGIHAQACFVRGGFQISNLRHFVRLSLLWLAK